MHLGVLAVSDVQQLTLFFDVVFWGPQHHKFIKKLNQSYVSVLYWVYLVTAICFDTHLNHHQAMFLNTSLFNELS
jgi:hypothetical protein